MAAAPKATTTMGSPIVKRPGVGTMNATIRLELDCDIPLASMVRRFGMIRAIRTSLIGRGYLALRDVSCDVHAGRVHLHGYLPTHYLKQVAQEAASEVSGVREVHNHIRVDAKARCSGRASNPSVPDEHLMRGKVEPFRAPRMESRTMLVLSRKRNESIIIDGNIRVTFLSNQGNQIRLGIEAPSHIGIYREELCVSLPPSDPDGTPSAAAQGMQEAELRCC
jgi:carbon storage regulator